MLSVEGNDVQAMMTNSMMIGKSVNKTGKFGGNDSKFSGKGSDLDHQTRKALSY